MTNKGKTIAYWRGVAAYDLDTARMLFKIGRYPYALFFGHLSLEKILKAIYVRRRGKHAPYTHNLILLAKEAGLDISDDWIDYLAEVTEFNIEARYPQEKSSFYKGCTRKYAERHMQRIGELYKWLDSQSHK